MTNEHEDRGGTVADAMTRDEPSMVHVTLAGVPVTEDGLAPVRAWDAAARLEMERDYLRSRGDRVAAGTDEAVAVPMQAEGHVTGNPTALLYYDPMERANRIWGTANVKGLGDVIWLAPIGSRFDALLFWRSGKRVATGGGPDRACFEGSLDEFEAAVEKTYAERVRSEERYNAEWPNDARKDGQLPAARHREDYRAAVRFLRSLA